MSYPGTTKTVAVGDGWKRIAALYNGDNVSTEIKVNGNAVSQFMVSCRTNAVQFAYSDDGGDLPVLGHPMATSDSFIVNKIFLVKNCWFKNETAGSAGNLIITPITEY